MPLWKEGSSCALNKSWRSFGCTSIRPSLFSLPPLIPIIRPWYCAIRNGFSDDLDHVLVFTPLPGVSHIRGDGFTYSAYQNAI